MAQYLIRLDDLCPTNNLEKWERFFNLFDLYGIKPVIAVIPDNQDPKLKACGSYNLDYWPLVRKLQAKNYVIGMHGFEHLYQTTDSGILKINPRSEFAGLPLHIQEAKIKAADSIFKRENVYTPLFVAPAHAFDHNTLLALNNCSDIRIISDGLLKAPYIKLGFKWIPVQLSAATLKTGGTWTFNYHPETCRDEAFYKLKTFIEKHHKDFVSLHELAYNPYTRKDHFTEHCTIYNRLLRQHVKNQIRNLKMLFGKK
jgi:hypothetical protein